MKVVLGSSLGVPWVAAEGQVTLGPPLEELRLAVEEALEAAPAALVLDLSRVNYVDSAGLGEIVAARRRAEEAGVRLALAGLGGRVRDLVSLTRLDELVEIHDSLEAALAALSAPR